ncbi:uncharacterized protein [Nicotiana tomentosiformis]|uniref:uncharacterized protein n=1 Tax=Nicotiana tomentosiformis TaxID=4098 RepID=UPI00051AD0B6|nr:uncharacterized protein LOC104087109 [Nicotiana tomentosiformis]
MMKELFQKRLSAFYNSLSFHKQDFWQNSDVVVIHSNQEKNSSNSQSNQFYLWLIGEELNDTTTIFTLYGIYFFCTQKNFSKIRSLCCCATLMQKIPVSVQLKAKNDEGFALIDATIRNERVIHNNKMFYDDVEDRCCPFVVGYIAGEYPKSKLFWSCINDLEPKKYKAATVNSGIDKLINTAEKTNFGFGVFNEKEVSKSVEFTPPMRSFSPIVNVGKEKRSLKTKRDLRDKHESNLWSENDEQVFLQFLENRNKSAPKTKENRFKFEHEGLRERRSNLGSSIDKTEVLWGEGIEIKEKGESSKSVSSVNENPLPTTKTDENVLLLMKNLNLSAASSSGKQDKLRVPNIHGDQLFKFRGSWLDAKEDNSKEGNKTGDQLFKVGANRFDGKGDKAKEGGQNNDQLFTFGANRLDGKGDKAKEGGKNDDQLFTFGANRLDGNGDKLKEGNKTGDQMSKVGANRLDGKSDKLKEGGKNYDQIFMFGANRLDGKGDKAIGGKSDDQLFKFGAKSLDGQEDKSKEGNKNGDQLFKFGGNWLDAKEDDKSKEGNKDGDQLFKSGEGKKDGEENRLLGIPDQPKLMEEEEDVKNVKLLKERLTGFYSSWREYKEEEWGKSDVLVIGTQSMGPLETLSRPISSSFLVWLLDREFPETTAVFGDTGIEFLCTKESFSRLYTIGSRITMDGIFTVSVQLKKGGEHCVDWLKRTLCQVNTALTSGENRCPLVVGCIKGESMEMEALSNSKMFEVAYVDNALTNLLEHGNFEKSESFAALQSTLRKQFQMLSLGKCGGAKTENAVSFSELAKIKSMDDKSYISHASEEEKLLLEKKGDTSSLLLTDSSVDTKRPVEENKVFEEGNKGSLTSKVEENKMFEEDNVETSTKEDGAEEKLVAEEQNMVCNPEKSNLLQEKRCEERMDYTVQPTGIKDAASENSLPDDLIGSSRKNSVGSDREDDDWTIIENDSEGKETEVAEKISWKRWFMVKTAKSFGLKDKVSDEAPSKED